MAKALKDFGFNLSSEAQFAKETALAIQMYMSNPQTKLKLQPYEAFLLQLFDMWTFVSPKMTQIREFHLLTIVHFSMPFTKPLEYNRHLCFRTTLLITSIKYWQYKYPARRTQDVHEVSHLSYNEQNTLPDIF